MRAVVQRVSEARVLVDGRAVGEIGPGLLVLLGVAKGDTEVEADAMASKVVNLRIFADSTHGMNRSLLETRGALLAVSQFTIYGSTSRGRRPSFEQAAEPVSARALYDRFVESCRALGVETQTGIFQASMAVHLVNDGPVTLICEIGPKYPGNLHTNS